MLCKAGEGRRLTAVRGLGLAVLLLAYLAWVTGCATAPPAPTRAAEDYLVPDQSAYFGVDVAANRELVSYVAGSLGVEADVIVNRIDLFAGSVDLADAGGSVSSAGAVSSAEPGFSGVAFGRFPQGATRFALWKDREFRRSVAGTDTDRLVYYRQVGGPLEVAVPESGIILLSTGSVAGLIRATGPPHDRLDPEIVERIRSVGSRGYGSVEGPDIVIVLPEPVSILTDRLGLDLPRFPILRLSLAVTVADLAESTAADDDTAEDTAERPVPAVQLGLSGEFQFSTETQAALFGRLGRVFILGFVRALGLETANLMDTVEIETDGTELRFQGIAVSPDELVGLAIRLTGQEL